jgi:hypothetical protein
VTSKIASGSSTLPSVVPLGVVIWTVVIVRPPSPSFRRS